MSKNPFNKSDFNQILLLDQQQKAIKALRIDLTVLIFNSLCLEYLKLDRDRGTGTEKEQFFFFYTREDYEKLWDISKNRADFILKKSEEMRDS